MATSPMDTKQLLEIAKQIQKAAESGDSSTDLLNILAPLEKFKATEDLLRHSKIGVAVTKLRQNKDPKVSEAATRLVSRWKQDVNLHKKKKANGESSPAPATNKALNGAASSSARNSATSSPAPPVKEEKKEEKKSSVDPDKRNTKTDAVNYQITGDAVRDGCLKLMYDGIAFMSQESPDDVLKVARKVEVAAFEHFKQATSSDYKAKMRSLYQNLKMKPNVSLRRDVFSESISATKFGMLKSS
jgi:transcription elongation factor S-II